MKSAKTRNTLQRVLAVLSLAVITVGCAQETKFRMVPGYGGGITRQQLQQSYSDYFIHYHTRIVVFDPIFDRLTIQVGDDWVLIENSNELAAIFHRLDLMQRERLAEIYQIVDSQGSLYGYVICDSGDLVSFKTIDENKMKIYYRPRDHPTLLKKHHHPIVKPHSPHNLNCPRYLKFLAI